VKSKLVLVHTVAPLVSVFDKLGGELLPTTQLVHILDEPLLQVIQGRGRLAPEDSARMAEHVAMAERSGASAVLVTCSTVSPCVDDIRALSNIPVMKIDEAMIARAVTLGPAIAVIATAASTLEPTRQLLQAAAKSQGRDVKITLALVEGALSALLAGDGPTHDGLVKEAVLLHSRDADVVVLAQASTARVLKSIPEGEWTAPILSSPHLALEQVGRLLASVDQENAC
jgi:hypothetical protein